MVGIPLRRRYVIVFSDGFFPSLDLARNTKKRHSMCLCVSKGETSFPIFLRHVFLRRSRKVALCASVGVSYFLVRKFAFFD